MARIPTSASASARAYDLPARQRSPAYICPSCIPSRSVGLWLTRARLQCATSGERRGESGMHILEATGDLCCLSRQYGMYSRSSTRRVLRLAATTKQTLHETACPHSVRSHVRAYARERSPVRVPHRMQCQRVSRGNVRIVRLMHIFLHPG